MATKIDAALADILSELIAIDAATARRSIDEFRSDWLFRRGVERGIEIISEASRRLPPDIQQTRPEIPWKKIMGIGNVLRHEYHRTVDQVVWRVVTEDPPPLRIAIEAIRANRRT